MEEGGPVRQRKILLIAYVFPPVGGIMVQRVLSFAKYLPQHGFDVHVLTAWNPATPVYDPSLLRQVPKAVKVWHAFTPEPPFYLRKKLWGRLSGGAKPPAQQAAAASPGKPAGLRGAAMERIRRILSPDAQALWGPFAIQRGARIIRSQGIDTVLVTAPPFSLFLIGNELKRRFPEIRLVSDFRDEWLRFMVEDFEFMSGDYTRRRAEEIERATIENSDLVVAVTRSSLAEIRCRYPAQPEEKFAFVPNGYDPEAFADFTPHTEPTGKVVITHVGTAYKTSSPAYYLKALDALPPEFRDRIETRFVGRIAETETETVGAERNGVVITGFVPQSEALRYMARTDYLLLTMTNDFSLPGKLFEYLATGKRILALSPPAGEVGRILEETGAGWCADPHDPAAIRQMLIRACQNAGREDSFLADREAIRQYERPRVAERLAGLLRGVPAGADR
jgi:glycosyltransferase involved in cell wall biosynthesis